MIDWMDNLADEISNRYELGLTDKEATSLAQLIRRRVREQVIRERQIADSADVPMFTQEMQKALKASY